MARIYISSTYEDLKNEREAAAQAIRDAKHQYIAMEDYVSSDQRPVDKCLQDVKSCDAYVGIFAWRYGYIPEGYDKSITHLEYETAKNAGIPCLIFLTKQEAKWTVEYVTTGEERIKINQLRSDLIKEHVVSFFDYADKLKYLVMVAICNTKLPGQISYDTIQNRPKLGPIAPKKCNRKFHVDDFMLFFKEMSKKRPKRPQFFFVHGYDGDGHDSFLERLKKIELNKHSREQWKEISAPIGPFEVHWPKLGSLEERKTHLKMQLIKKFTNSYSETDIDVNVLVQLPFFQKSPLVLINHNIYSLKWDKFTKSLITWYIKKFWTKFDRDKYYGTPLFLIFFNVIYQHSLGTGLKQKLWELIFNKKKRIEKKLKHLFSTEDEKCPCKSLKVLNSIEPDDVDEWLKETKIVQPEWKRKKIIEYIFVEDNKPVTSICWRDMEEKLFEIFEITKKCQSKNQY